MRRRLPSPGPCHSECNIIPFNVVDIIKSMLYYALAATPSVEEMSPAQHTRYLWQQFALCKHETWNLGKKFLGRWEEHKIVRRLHSFLWPDMSTHCNSQSKGGGVLFRTTIICPGEHLKFLNPVVQLTGYHHLVGLMLIFWSVANKVWLLLFCTATVRLKNREDLRQKKPQMFVWVTILGVGRDRVVIKKFYYFLW